MVALNPLVLDFNKNPLVEVATNVLDAVESCAVRLFAGLTVQNGLVLEDVREKMVASPAGLEPVTK